MSLPSYAATRAVAILLLGGVVLQAGELTVGRGTLIDWRTVKSGETILEGDPFDLAHHFVSIVGDAAALDIANGTKLEDHDRCVYRLALAVERRPGNALNVEIGTPIPRCRLKMPAHWSGSGASPLRWLASGGSPLVFGACAPCAGCHDTGIVERINEGVES